MTLVAPAWLRQLALLAAAAVFTWLTVRQLLLGRPLLAVLLLAAGGGALLLVRTREMALVWLLLVATFFPARILPLSLGPVRSDLGELLGLALVAAVVARIALGERSHVTAALAPLGLLVLSACFGAAVAAANGAPRASWLALLKTFFLYLTPVAFCWLFADRDRRDLLERWVHGICTFGGALVLTLTASGAGVPTDTPPEVTTLGVATEAVRLRPALLTLTLLATLLLAARGVAGLAQRADLLRLVIYLSVVAASFTRSTWVPLGLALLALAVIHPGPRIPLRGIRVTLVVALVGAIAFSAAGSGRIGNTPAAIALRVKSIGSDRVLEEKSYQDRKLERILAEQQLRKHPITGVGLGQPYGAQVRAYDPVRRVRVVTERTFIHNSVLGVWLWCGLLGLLALVWLGVFVVRTIVRAARQLEAAEAARSVAAGLAVLAIGLQSTFQTSITNRAVIATLACAVVFLDVPGLLARRKAGS